MQRINSAGFRRRVIPIRWYAAAHSMTPDQIAEAQRMAREWMEKHQQ